MPLLSTPCCLQACKLDAILVLRVQNGNDVFLSVTGTYCPSFFGVSLQTLALLPRWASAVEGTCCRLLLFCFRSASLHWCHAMMILACCWSPPIMLCIVEGGPVQTISHSLWLTRLVACAAGCW